MKDPLLLVKIRGGLVQIPEDIIQDKEHLDLLLDVAKAMFDYGLEQIKELRNSSDSTPKVTQE